MHRKGWIIMAVVAALLVVVLAGGSRMAGLGDVFLELHGVPPGAGHSSADEAVRRSAAERAIEAGWPDTPVGRVAGGWVEAYGSGEKQMKAFLEKNLTAKSLEEHPMDARLESYRDLYERMGTLMIQEIVESSDDELTVVLLAEDASRHRFIFRVEEEAPHRLVSVGSLQHGHGGGHH